MARASKRTTAATYTVADLLSDLGDIESAKASAASQMAKVTGAPIAGSKDSYYLQTAQEYGETARSAQSRVHEQAGTESLRVRCEASGAEWSRAWLLQQCGKACESRGLDASDVKGMAVTDFVLRQPIDDGVKRSKRSLEKLFPQGELDDQNLADCVVRLETIRDGSKADIDILREFFNGDTAKAKAIQAAIRKARHEGRISLPPNSNRGKRSKRSAR